MPSTTNPSEKLRARLARRDVGSLAHVKDHFDSLSLVPDLLNFTAAHPSFAKKLFDTHGRVHHLGSRLGRGEVLVWFLYRDVTLGGSSSSIDVHVGGAPMMEIKAARRSGERYDSFMLGIAEVPSSLKLFYRLLQLFEKNDRLGKLPLPQNFANLTKRQLTELRVVSTVAYDQAIDRYFEELFKSPVGQRDYLIFDVATGLPVHHGRLTREHLQVERVSGGLTRLSFKPS